jgi:hypothetical protein
MIKTKLSKIILIATLMITSSVLADNTYEISDTHSLVGVEVAYGSIDYDVQNSSVVPATYLTKSNKLGNIGLKLGAESEHYRVFLSARYFNNRNNDYDYITTYGAEADYLFNFSSNANFFVGVNGGVAYLKLNVAGEAFSRTASNSYYGGNIGLNYHSTKDVDLEFGSRIMLIDAINTKNNITYTFNNITSLYFSVIFKYQMD